MKKFDNAKSAFKEQKKKTDATNSATTNQDKDFNTKNQSFILSKSDILVLSELTIGINKISSSKVSKTKVLRALIQIGNTLKEDKIFTAIKELT